MNCRNCGAALNSSASECPYCGASTGNAPREANYGDNYNTRYQRAEPQEQHVYHHYDGARDNYRGYHPEEHVSTWGWIGRFILLAIPILNVILMIVWGFGGSSKRSLVTWARAQLIVTIIGVIAAVVFYFLSAAFGWNLFRFNN